MRQGSEERDAVTGGIRQPRYRKLRDLLRAAIDSGEFAEGEQFLTERAVVDRFEISRPTADKVLSGMVAEGLLEFRKGVGTYRLPRVTPGAADFLVSATGFASDRAVWWERTIYRGDSWEFHRHRAAPGRLIAMESRS